MRGEFRWCICFAFEYKKLQNKIYLETTYKIDCLLYKYHPRQLIKQIYIHQKLYEMNCIEIRFTFI